MALSLLKRTKFYDYVSHVEDKHINVVKGYNKLVDNALRFVAEHYEDVDEQCAALVELLGGNAIGLTDREIKEAWR